jgi:HSP20 family molecular chaperone IbpA
LLKAEQPGLSTDDIHLEVHERTLMLRGERQYKAEVKEGRVIAEGRDPKTT